MINSRLIAACLAGGIFVSPALAANLVPNGNFEGANLGPTFQTSLGGGWSAAPHWATQLNNPGSVATALLASTDTILPGSTQMLAVLSSAADSGIFQSWDTSGWPTYSFDYLSADIRVNSGWVQVVAFNGFWNPTISYLAPLPRWQRVNIAWPGTYEFVIYSAFGPADFSVDNVYGGFEPYPVPEPASWALMITGLAMVGGTLRSRRAQPS